MRRLVLLAAMPFLLSGCYWSTGSSGSSSGSGYDGPAGLGTPNGTGAF